MCDFEKGMKSKGEKKVWKNISSSNGSFKKVGQTQLGQQLLMTESIELVEVIRDWIETKCSNIHRKQLQDYFVDDQILLQKIMDTMLLLTLSSYTSREFNGKSSTRHKRVNLIQKKVMPELSFDITWRFLEVLVEASQYFEVERQSLFKDARIYTHLRYICTLPETITVKLAADAHIAFFPEPIVIKPLDWNVDEDGSILGGYHTFQYDLIRSRAGKVNYSKYSKKIFDTVNYIQSVSWKINTKMLDIVSQDVKIPNREDYVKSDYPDSTDSNWEQDIKDEEVSEKELNRIKKARDKYGSLVELYNAEVRDYESAVGKYRAVQLAIGIANRYRDEENIYFPHSYDSRGRIYPISVGLSPQGSDAIKSMIDYTDGEILTEIGESWAWAYLASLFGDDKIAFIHRVERGKELIEANYMEADEPYQFLSHQLELKKFLKDKNYLFKGRVHLDACNSGSQFTSAMTGDKAGCIATNVIPIYDEYGIQKRQDAYLLVSSRSLELLKTKIDNITPEDNLEALQTLFQLLEKDGRKICKKPVMVSNYGGTAGGRSEIMWDMLRTQDIDRKFITKKNSSLLSSFVGDSIAGVLNGGKAFETYIHKMNNVISKKGKPITWDTSDGFHVIHVKKKELKPKQVTCLLPGSRKATVIWKKTYSEDINPVKMKSAISPNYVHSLDAELLRRVALKMQEEGIFQTDWIHDSFGCHPNHVNLMLEITKEVFSSLMKSNPLKALDNQLRRQCDDSKASQKLINTIKIPDLGGLNADTDFDLVIKSHWFFS